MLSFTFHLCPKSSTLCLYGEYFWLKLVDSIAYIPWGYETKFEVLIQGMAVKISLWSQALGIILQNSNEFFFF